MKIVGLDVGTMFVVSAMRIGGENKVEIKRMRNAFLPIPPDVLSSSEISKTELDYVETKNEQGETESLYIIGEDSFKFANIFGQIVRRPMSKGVISPIEIDAIDVLTLMIEKLIGKAKKGFCVYSIPAEPVDIGIAPILYHEKVFGKILEILGYEAKPLNEGLSIIFSECQQEKFSGISVGFGCGLSNVCCAYKGSPALTFSVSRGGDWIDANTAESLGTISNRVTAIKEKGLDLENPSTGNRKEKRIKEALYFYYESLIKYVLSCIVGKFEENSDGLQIDEKIPIVISGGTSIPKGFIKIFTDIFSQFKEFPYEISEVRQAKDPLTAVAQGSLIYAHWNKRKEGQ